MGLQIFAIFLVLWTSAVIAQPLNSHYLPKEYYQRQNLPEIPGYIPVYIKHDDEPLPKWKDNGKPAMNDETEGEHSINKQNETEKKPVPAQPLESKNKTKKFMESSQTTTVKENKDF